MGSELNFEVTSVIDVYFTSLFDWHYNPFREQILQSLTWDSVREWRLRICNPLRLQESVEMSWK